MNLIDREQTIAHLKKRLIETAINNVGVKASCDSIFADIADNRIEPWINELPSEEKTGKWINHKDEHICSCCGETVTGNWFYEDDAYSYCPNCGSRMDLGE